MFTASIETDSGTYVHGFGLGTDERVAREFVQDFYHNLRPVIGTRIVTVALMCDGKYMETYDGQWESHWADMLFAEEAMK